jgi:hypothetical protein
MAWGRRGKVAPGAGPVAETNAGDRVFVSFRKRLETACDGENDWIESRRDSFVIPYRETPNAFRADRVTCVRLPICCLT